MSQRAPDLRGWGFTPGAEPSVRRARKRSATAEAQNLASRGAHNAIAFWLGALHRVPDVDEIITTWGVSRSTAYRWRAFALSGGTARGPITTRKQA